MKVCFKAKENKKLSPYTGWTRDHWEELVQMMLLATQQYLTPGKGGVALPNPNRWMDSFLPKPEKMQSFYWMEGFSRTRLLLATWLAGCGKTTLKTNGQEINILDQFIEGLLSASDATHPEYIGDRYGNNQWIAEISSIALAVYIAKDQIWANLNQKEKNQISNWIFSSTGKKIPHNNWYLFLVNTHLVLKALDEKYSQEEIDFCMTQIKSFDLGNGWFMDGDESRGFSIDLYNAWGFHYFLPAFIYIGGLNSEYTEWILDRLIKFINSFKYFFAKNGAIPMWGRSWTYRPALTAPFIWAEIIGVSPLAAGQLRRIVSGQMKYYIENDYFQEDMTPTMGYLGENLDLIDPYSQYGSTYWGSSIFLSLLLPREQAFWRQVEKPLPVECESYSLAEPEIGVLIAGNQKTGEVQIVNHRAWHQKEGPGTKYAKKYTNFTYSSHYGIDVKRHATGYNCDNMFSISPDGHKFSQRITPHFIKMEKDYGLSYHYPLSGFPFITSEDAKSFSGDSEIENVENESVKVITHTYLKDFCHLRIHKVESEIEIIAVREGAFALNFHSSFPAFYRKKDAIGLCDGSRGTFIKALWGFAGSEEIEKLKINVENSNTLNGLSITPTIIGSKYAPGIHIFISFSGTWSGGIERIASYLNLVTTVDVNQDEVKVEFLDGKRFRISI